MHVLSNCSCMVDGKVTGQSKFLSGSSKMVQKFSVGSLIFKNAVSTSSSSQVWSRTSGANLCCLYRECKLTLEPDVFQQLYMHCEVLLGKLSPTQSSKACNYDPATKK